MYILSIDQGTTGSTVSLLDHQGTFVASHDQDFPQIFPKPGWVEHDPGAIWNTVRACTQKVLEKSKVALTQIAAIGITNQRETLVVWDKNTGTPVYNAIVWQCRRTADYCAKLKKAGKEKMVQRKTGLLLDPYFSGTKLNWILKNVSGAEKRAKNGELLFGTIDTYLLWRLTGGKTHKTDVSNASRTLLMNLETLKWDQELLKLFSVPASMLPEIADSSGLFGVTKGLNFLPDGIKITGIAGDQQAALFGQTCFEIGEAKCTYGTGSFLLLNTGKKIVRSKAKMLTTVAWRISGEKTEYALEGGAFVCGAAVQWLRDGLEFIKSSSEVESLAKTVTTTEGVEFVPALTGLGAPYWDPNARGTIVGLTRGTTKAHLARATLEAMALQNVDILNSMQKDLGKKLKSVKVDGGASANNLLMQLQSDYMGTPVVRPSVVETTSMGAAYLAGLGCGIWKDKNEIKKIWQIDREFKAEMSNKDRKSRIERWHQAIKCAQMLSR